MVTLHALPKSVATPKKRAGQGYGSGRGGHTSGRGQKGQRSRSGIAQWFEGGQLPAIRRFPFIRGKSRFVPLIPKPVEISLSQLNRFQSGTTIEPKTLVDAGLVTDKELSYRPIKVLAGGTLTVALTVALQTSAKARQKIEAAGGKVISGQS